MAIRTFIASSTLLLCCFAVAFGQDVTGKWKSEFESQVGEQKYLFEFKVDGEKLTGKATGELKGEKREPAEIKDGKVKGEDISFAELLKIQDMEIRVEYSGKIKGDEIKLKRKVGDFAEYDITLKRIKDDPKKDESKKAPGK
jgi:hypothetical protein